MKISTKYFIIVAWILLSFLSGCKKEAAKINQIVPTIPTVITKWAFTNSDSPTAISGAEVTTDGGSFVTSRGVCWSTNQNPTIANYKTFDGAGIGEFLSTLTGLNLGTTYYIRAYATNDIGTAYGNQVSITTIPVSLALTAKMIERGETDAAFDVTVFSDGSSPVTARGICWGTKPYPTIADSKTTDGTGAGNFTSRVTGLDPSTDYYFRAYATNSDSTIYAIYLDGYKFNVYPRVYTNIVSAITPTTAIIWGGFDTDWEHPVNTRGVCWSTAPHPTIADNKSAEWIPTIGYNGFKCSISGLATNTTYYLRAYAVSIAGPHYGGEISFVPEELSGPSVSDIDGNIYHTVTIGSQTWMVENLKTSKYRNGDPIPEVTDGNVWLNLTSGAWCNYNDANYKFYDYSAFHGKLYNWYTVNDQRNIAPSGWHVPNNAEWATLINYLKNSGTEDVAKSMAAKSDWRPGNNRGFTDLATNNSSGFTALPAGYRVIHEFDTNQHTPTISADFVGKGLVGQWWSASESNGNVSSINIYLASYRLIRNIQSVSPNIITSNFKMDGYSIRCIKD